MTLGEYVKKRNGVPIGHPQSLSRNLHRSLGAKNFSSFWNYWNPIFGYYLGLNIFKPLKRFLPVSVCIILTFVFCGLIHDFVSLIIRGKTSFLFALWFLLMGLIVIITNIFKPDLAQRHWLIRALNNLSIISICLYLAYFLSRFLNINVIIF